MRINRQWRGFLLPTRAFVCAFAWLALPAAAQELAPRAYWPAPLGTDVLVVGFQRNTGDILVDPSLPITGVDSKIDYVQATYQRFFSLFDRTATAQFGLSYADSQTDGFIDGEFRERSVSGLSDARFRLAVNLVGAPAMDARQFAVLRQRPRTIVGASLTVQAPTGDYDADRVINLGTNRWSAKPAVGVIVPLFPSWLFEAEAGAWFFADNDNFVGETREQDPILSLELHLVKRFSPGFWASLDANLYRGGETRIGSGVEANLQRNSRAGFTLVVPVKRRFALRGSYSTGLTTRAGGDFDLFSISLLYAW
jgi:hypothetical protein